MTSTITLAFACSVCGHEIRGQYEEEDFDYPVFCPKCGRQNRLPAQATEPVPPQTVMIQPPEPALAVASRVQALEPVAVSPASTPEPPSPREPAEVPVLPDNSISRRALALGSDVLPEREPDASAFRLIPPGNLVRPVPPSPPTERPQPAIATVTAAAPVPRPVENAAPVVMPPVIIQTSVPATPAIPASSAPPAAVPQSRGRTAWRFRPASSLRPVVALRNCVAVDDRGRLVAALGPDLFALTPSATGCEVDWKFTAGDHIPGSPVIGADGVVFAHSSDGYLHAIDANGTPARPPTKLGPALGWATPLVDANNRVWICAATGGLIRVEPSGQTSARLFFRHPSRFDSTGALRGDVLYLGSEDQFLHAVDLQGERGRDRWNQTDKIGLTGWYINSAIALDGDSHIIAVSRDDQMYSFDETGAAVWTVPLNGRAIGSPVIAPNGIIVIGLTTRIGESDALAGRLVGIHSKTGQFAWRLEFDAPLESTPVVGGGGEIYVGDNSGKIHAVNGQGQRVWSETVGSAVRSAGTILPAGQVVFGLDDGSVVALRCSSQSLGGPWPKLLATAANRCQSGG